MVSARTFLPLIGLPLVLKMIGFGISLKLVETSSSPSHSTSGIGLSGEIQQNTSEYIPKSSTFRGRVRKTECGSYNSCKLCVSPLSKCSWCGVTCIQYNQSCSLGPVNTQDCHRFSGHHDREISLIDKKHKLQMKLLDELDALEEKKNARDGKERNKLRTTLHGNSRQWYLSVLKMKKLIRKLQLLLNTTHSSTLKNKSVVTEQKISWGKDHEGEVADKNKAVYISHEHIKNKEESGNKTRSIILNFVNYTNESIPDFSLKVSDILKNHSKNVNINLSELLAFNISRKSKNATASSSIVCEQIPLQSSCRMRLHCSWCENLVQCISKGNRKKNMDCYDKPEEIKVNVSNGKSGNFS